MEIPMHPEQNLCHGAQGPQYLANISLERLSPIRTTHSDLTKMSLCVGQS